MNNSSAVNHQVNATPRDCVRVEDRVVQTQGRLFKIARVHDELWIENGTLGEPVEFVNSLRSSSAHADAFTFAQSLPETNPSFSYHMDVDNLAVTRTSNFAAWWEGLPQESRKNVRRAERRGLVTGPVDFSPQLVKGIKEIYDETPIRQGRRFWHYRKDLETIALENSSYLERSQFVATHHGSDLAGFIKMVYVGPTARIMQIISKNSHADKRPTNALLAKAIEICAAKGIEHLIYGQFVYDNKADSPVTEFKRRNGFYEVLLPRYYIPLTAKGRIALRFKLYKGLKGLLPGAVHSAFIRLRQSYYERTLLRERELTC
jgi:hypothetical protein